MSLKNSNPITTWKKGDQCWYHEHWSDNPNQAVITDIKTHESFGFLYAELKGINESYGSTCRVLDELFATKQDVLDAMALKSNSRLGKFKASISTVEDLIRFGYEHNVAHAMEYTDHDARQAYREKAKELLGLELED